MISLFVGRRPQIGDRPGIGAVTTQLLLLAEVVFPSVHDSCRAQRYASRGSVKSQPERVPTEWSSTWAASPSSMKNNKSFATTFSRGLGIDFGDNPALKSPDQCSRSSHSSLRGYLSHSSFLFGKHKPHAQVIHPTTAQTRPWLLGPKQRKSWHTSIYRAHKTPRISSPLYYRQRDSFQRRGSQSSEQNRTQQKRTELKSNP